MQYKDNILGKNLFNSLKNTLEDPFVPYYYTENIAIMEESQRHIFDSGLSHLVFQDGQSYSNLSPFLESACLAAFDNAYIPVQEIVRIRIGLLTATTDEIIHKPHIDFEKPHNSALLYINDTDGDTIFYDQFYDTGITDRASYEKNTEFTIKERVAPVSNRLVWFDGHQYHSSSTPQKHSKRLVVNINYV